VPPRICSNLCPSAADVFGGEELGRQLSQTRQRLKLVKGGKRAVCKVGSSIASLQRIPYLAFT
jgi:hypothetical protein